MDIPGKLRAKAKKNPKKIVLPEGEDIRTIKAAGIVLREGYARLVLLGDKDKIRNAAEKEKVDLSGTEILDPGSDSRKSASGGPGAGVSDSGRKSAFAGKYFEIMKRKGVTLEEAGRQVSDPINFGIMMLHENEVDGFVAGAAHTTADTVRPALYIIKPDPKIGTISSFFIMVVPDCEYGDKGVMFFADCAINPDPSATKLANIAVSSARMAELLCDIKPRVAMLSFSTKGSAQHELVDKVREATRIAKEKAPGLEIDGEIQADAALVPSIGIKKSPGSAVAGKANVLIFPDLQSGNIGYKLVQRLSKAEAIGPVLQGFNKPVSDLSRGCSVDDIANLVAITVIQASL